jgi:hypothetical protein
MEVALSEQEVKTLKDDLDIGAINGPEPRPLQARMRPWSPSAFSTNGASA